MLKMNSWNITFPVCSRPSRFSAVALHQKVKNEVQVIRCRQSHFLSLLKCYTYPKIANFKGALKWCSEMFMTNINDSLKTLGVMSCTTIVVTIDDQSKVTVLYLSFMLHLFAYCHEFWCVLCVFWQHWANEISCVSVAHLEDNVFNFYKSRTMQALVDAISLWHHGNSYGNFWSDDVANIIVLRIFSFTTHLPVARLKIDVWESNYFNNTTQISVLFSVLLTPPSVAASNIKIENLRMQHRKC